MDDIRENEIASYVLYLSHILCSDEGPSWIASKLFSKLTPSPSSILLPLDFQTRNTEIEKDMVEEIVKVSNSGLLFIVSIH